MMTLDVCRDPLAPDLARLDELLRWRHPELPNPSVAQWTEEPLVVLDGGEPWVVTPVERDPLALDGRTVMPRAARRKLIQLAAGGVDFPRFAIAHQIDAEGPARGLLPVLESGPRPCSDEVARMLVGRVPPNSSERAVRAVVRAMRSGGRAIAATAEVVLDPIIFGVTGPAEPRHGATCLWYPLTAWRW